MGRVPSHFHHGLLAIGATMLSGLILIACGMLMETQP